MSDVTLFLELFPLQIDNLPDLSAFQPEFETLPAPYLLEDMSHRLSRSFGGHWVWTGHYFLTDASVSGVQMDMAIDMLRENTPEAYKTLKRVTERAPGHITPEDRGRYLTTTRLIPLDANLQNLLTRYRKPLKNGVLERDFSWRLWSFKSSHDGSKEAALSLSLHALVKYHRNVQQMILDQDGNDGAIAGLTVVDKTNHTIRGVVQGIVGDMHEHRADLLAMSVSPALQRIIKETGDSEQVIAIETQAGVRHYPGRALHILVHDTPDDYARFGLDRAQVRQTRNLPPPERAEIVKTLSGFLKDRGIIGSSYNNRTHPTAFNVMDFMPNVVFSGNRVRPAVRLASALVQGGVYRRHPRFGQKAIKIATINTMEDTDTVGDFIEALRRQLEKKFGYAIDMLRERRVRVLNAKNLERAVRVVEKESPHVVMAFFGEDDDTTQSYDDYLKSLTLARGIASHIVDDATLNDPDSMPRVIMSLLAKTGNIPYALAEPLEYTDYVVGLDIIRETLSRGDRVVALARIYRSDGSFIRYVLETVDLDSGDTIPFVVLQTLFPEDIFNDQTVIIHHNGALSPETAHQLNRWQDVLQATFQPVEIIRHEIPHLYALTGSVSMPPWGSLFWLNEDEAFVVVTPPTSTAPAEPLHIRCKSGPGAAKAIYSILAWALLHYGTGGDHLPVTIRHADTLRGWFARGILPEERTGDVAFWL